MLDMLSQIYIVSAAVGSIYLVLGLVLGQLHGHADAAAAHGDAGGAGGHEITPGQAHAPAHGQDTGLPDTSQPQAQPAAFSHLKPSPHLDIAASGPQHVISAHQDAGTAPVQLVERRPFGLLRLLLTALSPMTIAVFLAFFGISGLILAELLPFLGPLTWVPAVMISLLVTGQVLRLLRWMILKMHVTSLVKVNELIGHSAEVLTPIQQGRTGEVTYVVGSTRLQAAAKPAKPGMEFKRGAKVMISDIRDTIFYVEPWEDILLEDSFVFETREK